MRESLSKRGLKSSPTQIRAVIFDLDGTLIHSAIDFTKLKRRTIDFLARKGLSAERFSTKMKTYDIMHLASSLFREKGFTEQGFTLTSKKIEEIWNQIELESVSEATPIEGAEKTLLELKKQGLKIGIVTRGCREYAVEALKITGLLDVVDVIVGRGDVVQPKPSPEPLIKAVEMLGLRVDEVVMVGDNVEDAQCASSAKVRFIGVVSGLSKVETFGNSGCETTISDLRDLIDVLSWTICFYICSYQFLPSLESRSGDVVMPQKIICGGCGEVFYHGDDLKPPEEIIQQLKGTCPECGRKLSFNPKNIDIRALQEEEKDRR